MVHRRSAPAVLLPVAAALAGCSPGFEPDGDASVPGGPVGVRTEAVGELTVELWYPAHPRERGSATEAIDFLDALSPATRDRLGPVSLPTLDGDAIRDARPHPDGPFPVVLFSHGFGGTRHQSVTLTRHLASRGFVVVAPDHPGRALGGLVPCLFSPPVDGCELALTDPGPDQLAAVLDWLDAPPEWLAPLADVTRVGAFGHSAGGGSVATLATRDERVDAVLPMAGMGSVDRDLPAQWWAGTCDATVPAARTAEGWAASTAQGPLVLLEGAGHLAFADLCALELGTIAAELERRDDVSTLLLGGLRALATDGCPGAPLPAEIDGCEPPALLPDAALPLVRAGVAAFFAAQLRGEGDGTGALDGSALTVTPADAR